MVSWSQKFFIQRIKAKGMKAFDQLFAIWVFADG
jgi:hypothetical protein